VVILILLKGIFSELEKKQGQLLHLFGLKEHVSLFGAIIHSFRSHTILCLHIVSISLMQA